MRKCTSQIVRRYFAFGTGFIVSVLAMALRAQASIVYYYDANAATPAPDPKTFSGGPWTLGGTVSTVTTLPGQESATGPNYWEVNDGASGGSQSYSITGAASSVVGTALTNPGGWQATVTLKVLSSANPSLTPPSYNVPTVFDIRNGSKIYDLAFVNDGTNEAVYNVQTGTTFNNSNKIMDLDLHDGYNTFTILYHPDPTAPTADVFLNGGTTPIFTFTNANTNTSGTFRVFWGSGLTAATQDVRWQYVSLEAVPEPASMGLLSVIGLMLLPRKRRS